MSHRFYILRKRTSHLLCKQPCIISQVLLVPIQSDISTRTDDKHSAYAIKWFIMQWILNFYTFYIYNSKIDRRACTFIRCCTRGSENYLITVDSTSVCANGSISTSEIAEIHNIRDPSIWGGNLKFEGGHLRTLGFQLDISVCANTLTGGSLVSPLFLCLLANTHQFDQWKVTFIAEEPMPSERPILSDIIDLWSASQTCRTFQSKTTRKRENILNDCVEYSQTHRVWERTRQVCLPTLEELWTVGDTVHNNMKCGIFSQHFLLH